MQKPFLAREQFDLKNWNDVDHYTRLMYHWLPDFGNKIGRTYCLINLAWPRPELIKNTPKGYDTYVLTFDFEYLNFDWIQKFCQAFSDSQVVLIAPYDISVTDTTPNLRTLNLQNWPIFLDWYQKELGFSDVDFEQKNKKVSSLCWRINQFRSYVVSYLYQNWAPKDYVLSWHGEYSKTEDFYLLNHTGNAKIDSVIDFLKNNLWDSQIKPGKPFDNTPLSNFDYDWEAYTDCVINCTNESFSCSFQIDSAGNEQILPGPYLTEKTWKCLLSRSAMLPVGQYQTYTHLENLGFQFDCPWNKDFDNIPEDITRIEKILDVLDELNTIDIHDLKQHVKASCDHNREHIVSGGFLKTANDRNETHIQKFYAS